MRRAVNTRSCVGNVRGQAVVAYFRASKGPLELVSESVSDGVDQNSISIDLQYPI